jgi:CelD/BcsL family acetyltransferase involved in cellulose biosynthesis
MHGPAQFIDTLEPDALSPEDVALWTQFLGKRPDLSGPYFDPRYVQAVGARVPHAGIARLWRDGHIAGYFPYQLRAGALQPLGAPLTDYHGVVGEPDLQVDFNGLLRATGAKRLEFQGWAGSLCPKAASLTLRRRVADLSDGFDAWYQRQEAAHHKFFKNIRRCERNVEKDFGGFAFTWERVTPQVLDWVLDIKRNQYRHCGLHDIFNCGWTLDLLRDLADYHDDAYGLRAGVFRHEGRVVAAEIGLLGADQVHLWFPAYDPAYYRYSIGILLVVQMMRHLAPSGIKRFDFGTGGEEYKDPLTVHAESVCEGELTYRLQPFTELLNRVPNAKLEAIRLSLRRRLGVINATEITLSGWTQAAWAMGQRALMRVRAAPKQA